jgi:glycine cleavage system H protein
MIPTNLKYSESHEWAKISGEKATIGITDYAQEHLGDVVFIEAPQVGDEIEAGAPCGTIESVKAVEDLSSPLSGEVIEVNEVLEEKPEKVNEDPYAAGWIFKIKLTDKEEVDDLMDADEYEEYLEENE